MGISSTLGGGLPGRQDDPETVGSDGLPAADRRDDVSRETSEAWVREAARLPLAFSQVREDPFIDQALLAELPRGARLFLIASGGDTAAWLAASGRVGHLQLVDVNPAQLALTRLKLKLLRESAPPDRLAILGHADFAPEARSLALAKALEALALAPDVFGPPDWVAHRGPDHAGRYEVLFDVLREKWAPFRQPMDDLLGLMDPAEQARRIAPTTPLGQALDAALDSVMRLENLVGLFGAEATQNPLRPFSRHFAERIRDLLGRLPARDNPFLAQMLGGRFLRGAAYPWLLAQPEGIWPEIAFVCSKAERALEAIEPESLDLVHLSNILDWLAPAAAAQTLALAWKALRPGGLLILRQLNSSLGLRALGPRFLWRATQAEALHAQDRSFFYRALHVGEKPLGR